MLNYKVSYEQEWDKEGTHYSQMITISIPSEQILKHLVNAKIRAYKGIHQDFLTKLYFQELNVGKNYVSLSFRDFVVNTFLNQKDNRILDRNTIIRIILDPEG